MPDASLAESHRHCCTLVQVVARNTSLDQHSIRNWLTSCLHLQRVQSQPGHIIRLFLMYLLGLSKLGLLHTSHSHEELPQLTRSQLATLQLRLPLYI
ncbi:hypothetical protein Ciccas_000694 [Cichlidogyrus casuarinus]|uniref:Uncharacterized protein n=1 Tax=Cichlidogyrus casuarinus TaxID=1844966 RepID=A0ABD2QM50_9PLAT